MQKCVLMNCFHQCNIDTVTLFACKRIYAGNPYLDFYYATILYMPHYASWPMSFFPFVPYRLVALIQKETRADSTQNRAMPQSIWKSNNLIIRMNVLLALFIVTNRQASRRSRLCPSWRFLTRTWRALWTNRATSWVWRVSEAFQTWLSAPCNVQVSAIAAALTRSSTWNCARSTCTSPHDWHSYLAANTDR